MDHSETYKAIEQLVGERVGRASPGEQVIVDMLTLICMQLEELNRHVGALHSASSARFIKVAS